MHRSPWPLAALVTLAACYEDVPRYCDPSRPCADEASVCLLPDRQCAPAEAWAELSGLQVTPPLPSLTTGTLKLARNGTGQVAYNLQYQAPAGVVRGVHVHKGRPGGPPGTLTIPLGSPAPPAGPTIMAALDLGSDDLVMGLLAGEYYVDVHTDNMDDDQGADVEARGQIWPMPGLVPLRLTAVLTARQESQPNASSALGTAEVVLDEEGGVAWLASLTGWQGALTYVHIHRGPFSGEIGPHVLDFGSEEFMAGGGAKEAGEVYAAQRAAYPFLLRAGLTYFNVHTSEHRGGEVRGQLLPPGASGGRPELFAVALQPTPTAPATFSAVAYFVLSDDERWLSFRLDHNSVPNVTTVKLVNGAMMVELPAGRLLGIVQVADGTAVNRADLMGGKLSVQIATRDYAPALTGKLVIPRP
jgi:hypothetical protein